MQWWASLPDGVLAGRYRIEGKIGEGGMAEVFLARQQPLDNKVAIKVPKLGSGDSAHLLDRFKREVTRQNQERIVGVIGLLDAGGWEGGDGRKRPYLVMEYVSGGSLADRLGGHFAQREHRQSAQDVLAWLTPIATTLDRLHGRGLLHRDVKPDNILFNADGDPLLSDFGIATTLDGALGDGSGGSTGLWVVGSPGYMPPEAASGEKVAASDQFSLAITVYAALAGQLPIQPTGIVEWMKALASWYPQHLATLRPELPLALADAVMKAMASDPKERFASCSAFATRMREALHDPRAPAQPTSGVGLATRSDSDVRRARQIAEGWHFVAADGNLVGPLTQQALRQMFARGLLDAHTLVWTAGMTQWQAYGGVFEQDLSPPLPSRVDSGRVASAPATVATPIPSAPTVAAAQISGPPPAPSGALAGDPAANTEAAPLGHRFLARVIDAVLFTAMLGFFIPDAHASADDELSAWGWLAVVAWVTLTLVQAWFLTRDGQSIGKKMMHIRIVDAGTGANPGFLRAFVVRELGYGITALVSLVLVAPVLIDVLPIYGANRQCLHDRIVSTRVVTVGANGVAR